MKYLLIALALVSAPALAHEGHNHDAPTTIQAPKGGVVKALDEARVEVVAKGKDIKIYVYDKDMKPRDAAGLRIVATAELPRNKKSDAVAFQPKGNQFEGTYDAKGAHRYALKLSVTDTKTGRTDNLSFNIEPRK